jgi:hypothetical protein
VADAGAETAAPDVQDTATAAGDAGAGNRAGAAAGGDVARTDSTGPASQTTGAAAAVDTAVREAAGAAPGAGTVAIDPARVLVLIRGEATAAVETAETTVLAELLAKQRPFVDPALVAGIRGDEAAMRALSAGASPAVEVGREFGAGTVVVGDLVTDATEAVVGLITGTAVLTASCYDVRTGRLVLSETYQVGAGGVPGKAGVTVTDAVTQAAEAVARQLSRAILQKTGG